MASITFALLAGLFFQPAGLVAWLFWLVTAASCALLSVLGDLTVSLFKRHQGMKDSGNIIPGHGGILDLMDGMIAALPLFIAMISLVQLSS